MSCVVDDGNFAMNNKDHIIVRVCLLLLVAACVFSMRLNAETWDVRDNSLGAALAYEDKTNNDTLYEGAKLFIEGKYIHKSEAGETSERRRCCLMPSRPEYLYGLVDGQLRFGFDGAGLEYIALGFTPWATLYEPEIEDTSSLRATSDLVELGVIRYISDDPLEVDYYLELSLFRAGRSGIYTWNDKSPYAITGHIQASAGWSWAETKEPGYSSVSNPFAGIFFKLALEHESWGEIYIDNRFVNGFSFSNPSRGHPTVREARVGFGYLKEFSDNLTLDIYGEKKSFYFDEGDLPNLYRMSRAVAIDLTWHW